MVTVGAVPLSFVQCTLPLLWVKRSTLFVSVLLDGNGRRRTPIFRTVYAMHSLYTYYANLVACSIAVYSSLPAGDT